MVKIEFSKDEFEKLAKVFYLAGWMAHSSDDEEGATSFFHALEQKVLAEGEKAGWTDLVSCIDGVHGITQKKEDELMEIIGDYDNTVLWEELADRLAIRDVVREKGEKVFEEMSLDQRADVLGVAGEKYQDEFEKYGLDRVRIKE